MRTILLATFVVLVRAALPAQQAEQPQAARPESLQRALDDERDVPAVLRALTERFYDRTGGALGWASRDGRAAARVLAGAIDVAPDEGLPRGRFETRARIDTWLARVADPEADEDTRARADTAVTRAFLEYAAVLARGWNALDGPSSSARDIDVAAILAEARDEDAARRAIERLLPRHAEYRALRRALGAYRGLAERIERWPRYPSDVVLKRTPAADDSEEQVLDTQHAEERQEPDEPTRRAVGALVARLALSRTLPPDVEVPVAGDGRYSAALERAVRAFQRVHGLVADGIVGPKTAAALNTTAAERVRQIAVNMDRWRRLPDDMGARHVRVNVPAFSLQLREHGAVTLRMRVVGGAPRHQTPIFDGVISYLVFRPYWNIPASIARNEIAPKAAGDPSYLDEKNIQVLDGWSPEANPVDPFEIDWENDEFPYRLRQAPGRSNALGLVKFMFPNPHHVYLHDTNAPALFEQDNRARSHGCVRVEQPARLAAALLAPQGWTIEQVRDAMHGGSRQVVSLAERVPVYLQYLTAWVNEGGELRFAPDVYGRDARAIAERFAGAAGDTEPAYFNRPYFFMTSSIRSTGIA